jgi:hypothetical protein
MFLGLTEIEPRRLRLWQVRDELRRASRPVATLAEFLLPEDIAWLESTAALVARTWYLDGDHDRSLYRGVSLGSCCEYDLKAKAIRLLKFALTCRRMIARYPGRPVYSDYSQGSREAQLLDSLGIATRPFDVREEPSTEPPRSRRANLRATLSRRGRALGLSIAWLASRARRIPDGKPIVVVRPSLQSIPMLERWLEQEPRSIHMSIWMSHLIFPRRVLKLLLGGATLVPPGGARHPVDAAELKVMLTDWVAAGSTVDLAEVIGLPLQEAFGALFDRAAQLEFLVYAATIDHAYAALERSASALALPNDCQGIMRAWALVARRTGTQTVIVQHGHLDYTEDGDHFVGDYSAFWTQMVCDQYAALGLEPSRMLVTGSPNADVFVAPAGPAPARDRSERTRVLVITTGNPGVQAYIDETWVTDYIVRVLSDLCDGHGRFDVAVKLHPGESVELYRQHVQPWIGQLSSLADTGSLADWLSRCDIVISPPSTVVLEARARGLPVVLLPIHSADGRRTNLRDLEGVVAVDEHESITEAIQRIAQGHRAPSEGGAPLSDYMGPIDGGASLRLLEALEEVALRRASSESAIRATAMTHAGRTPVRS